MDRGGKIKAKIYDLKYVSKKVKFPLNMECRKNIKTKTTIDHLEECQIKNVKKFAFEKSKKK